MREWTLTDHARQRAGEMGVALADVVATVETPELVYPAPSAYRGCRVAVRGRLAVPFDPDVRTVITVMPNVAPDGGEPFVRGRDDRLRPRPGPEADVGTAPGPTRTAAPADVRRWRRLAGRAASRTVAPPQPGCCLDCFEVHGSVVDALACDTALYGTT